MTPEQYNSKRNRKGQDSLGRCHGDLFSQTETIPTPLEIHPSVDPELAKGLMAACEALAVDDSTFHMASPVFVYYEARGKKVGCMICHAQEYCKWRRPAALSPEYIGSNGPHPLGSWERIFWQNAWERAGFPNGFDTSEGRFARIEYFLRTGE